MNSRTTINSANDFAQNYDNYIQNCYWFGTDILFGLMYEYISSKQTLIDLGIGTGLSSRLFKQFGLTIYGIDGAEEMIKVCQNKGLAKELRQVDLAKNEVWFENKTFDNVVSHGVFHLIGDLKHIFKQTSLILDNNGCFGFTYEGVRDSADDYKESSIAGLFERQNLLTGINVFRHTDKYIFELLDSNGFQLLKQTEFLAFVDSNTKTKTYFNAIVAKKK
jgi:predicted TPR repeat methyltransferase